MAIQPSNASSVLINRYRFACPKLVMALMEYSIAALKLTAAPSRRYVIAQQAASIPCGIVAARAVPPMMKIALYVQRVSAAYFSFRVTSLLTSPRT
jgi:hypothetical protein